MGDETDSRRVFLAEHKVFSRLVGGLTIIARAQGLFGW
jgi:hypothetical protein